MVGLFSLWISVAFQTIMTEYYVLFVIFECIIHAVLTPAKHREIYGFFHSSVIIHVYIISSVATHEALSDIIS